ncbi:hypothetical protein ACLB2K_075334 [Fragaria x ananassa]
MTEEQLSSNYDDFIKNFDYVYKLQSKVVLLRYVMYFEKYITVVATSFQATSAVRSLVQDSLSGTIPFKDNVGKLIRYMEEYDPEQEVLTNNLDLFCTLLDGISDDAMCENEETHVIALTE